MYFPNLFSEFSPVWALNWSFESKIQKVSAPQTPSKFFYVVLVKNVSFVDTGCANYLMFVFPFLNFGPWVNEGGFMSTLERQAFAIELTAEIKTAYLLLGENIKDEQFYWVDLYKLQNGSD